MKQQPLYVDAHRDLAQLIWMRTEDKDQAVAAIDAGLQRDPNAVALRQLKAKVLTFAGDLAGADAVLQEAALRYPDDAAVQMSAAQAAIEAGDAARGLAHAERSRALSAPGDAQRNATFVCEAMLALGRAKEAAALAEEMARQEPQSQQALAYLATAWRILGDPRYGELYDYAAFVRPWTIDVPAGWSSLDAYLADLTEGSERPASAEDPSPGPVPPPGQPGRPCAAIGASGHQGVSRNCGRPDPRAYAGHRSRAGCASVPQHRRLSASRACGR